MDDHILNKGRNARGKCLTLVGLLVLLALPAGAAPEGKCAFGVYSGRSFGLGDVFIDMTSGGHTHNHYQPDFLLGAYFQHDFSESFGLQLDMNYQHCSNHWEFTYWERREEGTDSISCGSFSLNGIFTVSRSAMTQFYLLGGIGIFVGSFENLGSFIQCSGGTGGKLRVRPGSSTSLNLAAVFHHLMYKYGSARHADYLKLQAGLEFLFKDRPEPI
jgi:opacity protein-like surface antigen